MRAHAMSVMTVLFTAEYLTSLRHEGERPDGAAARNLVADETRDHAPAQPRENRHVLHAFVGVGNGRGVDARAGLELPKRLARVLVERHELAARTSREEESTACREHACRIGRAFDRNFPLRLACERIHRHVVTDDV